MTKTIFFDMDGTIADLYGVENWLEYLKLNDTFPYKNAKPLVRLSTLARTLNELQKRGYRIGVISWGARNASLDYNKAIVEAKMKWLNKHLASVKFDEINIVAYGTPKSNFARTENDILFDDEERNRKEWTGTAYDEKAILKRLREM